MDLHQYEQLRLEPDEYERLVFRRTKRTGKNERSPLFSKYKGYSQEQLDRFNSEEMTEEQKDEWNNKTLKEHGLL